MDLLLPAGKGVPDRGRSGGPPTQRAPRSRPGIKLRRPLRKKREAHPAAGPQKFGAGSASLGPVTGAGTPDPVASASHRSGEQPHFGGQAPSGKGQGRVNKKDCRKSGC